MNLHRIENARIETLKEFLKLIPVGRKHFRYFNHRPLEIITNHLETILLYSYDQPIGYGHLEHEHDKLWLGIAIADNSVGKGIGSIILNYLITSAVSKGEKRIFLAVDVENNHAQHLYKKHGFVLLEQTNSSFIYFLDLKDKL